MPPTPATTGTPAAGAADRQERSLQNEPQDFRTLLASLGAIVWEGDPRTFRMRYVSEGAERLLGHPVQRWLEEPRFWIDHLHPEDRDWVVATCSKQTEAGRAHDLEYRMIAADGRVVWLRDICSVELEGGEPARVRGVMVDITEQKRAEEAARVADERLRSVVENAPVILFALDAQGILTFCEGASLQAIDLTPARVVGRSGLDVVAEAPQARRNLERALAGEAFTDTVSFRDRIFVIRYNPVRGEDRVPTGVIGVATDVTERMRAEQERRQLEAQVLHTQKLESLGVLAGGIAHDFNNLLMTILGNVDIALMDLGTTAPPRSNLDRIRDAAQRAAALTNQLLAYCGHSPVALRQVDLSVIVADMAELLDVSISKKAKLCRELALDPPAVDADPAQLTQVVLNLITNASESLGEAGGTITLRTGVTDLDRASLRQTYLRDDLEEGRYVFLEVQDTGAGMDAETRAKLFDPFFTTKFAGRGLGLAAVLGIVRAHGGGISVYSEPGRGSLFRVLLPCSREAHSAPRAPAAEDQRWRGSGTVLVVDDEPHVREVAEEMLRRLGFEVVTARDGREGLARFRERPQGFAAVLLDLTMPELGGEETLAGLRELRPGLPILLMSGFTERDAAERVPEAQGIAFLQKPFSREQLAGAVRAVLDGPG